MGRFIDLTSKSPFEWVILWEKMNGKKSTRKVRAWDKNIAESMFLAKRPKSFKWIISTKLVQ